MYFCNSEAEYLKKFYHTMTVLYFSATGNSMAVGKALGARLVAIPSLLRKKEGVIEITDEEGIGIVAPVYFGQLPVLVRRLLERVRLSAPYIFGILTYGELAGRAATHLLREGERNGIRFDYISTIKMVDNNFTIVDVEKQVRTQGRKHIPERSAEIVSDVRARKRFIEKPGAISKIIGMVEERMPQNPAFDSRFSVETAKCIGCGVCVKVCPNANIRLADGSPEWLGDCLKCTACYHNCPSGAIRYKGEKSQYCYRNPAVSLKEIIGD